MKAFTKLTGVAIPLGLKNVDTDVILPAAHLKVLTRTGLGRFAFTTLRYTPDGAERPESIFNQPRYRGAPIIVARENFGCGSSREHAAWALADMGVRAVIAPSFGDIFAGNAYRNGILTIILPDDAVEKILVAAEDGDLSIDLDAQSVDARNAGRFSFDVDPFRKHCLLNGLDEIAFTEKLEDRIAAYEQRFATERPWLLAAKG